ncbi:MAG: hypothetical protein NTY45_07850 [Elusimicrobia bacterium]|nr:hypothetical protein [Elusimicrobiota bacterium]
MKKLLYLFIVLALPYRASAQAAPGPLLGTFRLGLDLPGNLSVAGADLDSDADTQAGLAAGFELVRGYDNVGLGLGLELLPRRGLQRSPGTAFGFLALPLILEFSDYGSYGSGALTPYFRLQGGPDLFLPGHTFLGSSENGGPNACAGIGVGVRKKRGFTAELRFSFYRASLDHNKIRLLYSAPRLSAGYSF